MTTAAELEAVALRTVKARRTSVRLFLFHEIDEKARDLLSIFKMAEYAREEICNAIAREMAESILRDVEILQQDLDHWRRFAEKQLEKTHTPLRTQQASE
jgi:hypothetical protein